MLNTECKEATRFRHHFLTNGGILTVATSLEYETRKVRVGWAIFNPADVRWIRKFGAILARGRMNDSPLYFTLTDDEPVMCDYISLRALQLILVNSGKDKSEIPEGTLQEHPSSIPKNTLCAIQYESYRIMHLLGQRVGLFAGKPVCAINRMRGYDD